MLLRNKYGQDWHVQIVADDTFIDALVTHIPDDSILLEMKEDIKETVIVPVHIIPESEQSGLEHCFNTKLDKFKLFSENYDKWI